MFSGTSTPNTTTVSHSTGYDGTYNYNIVPFRYYDEWRPSPKEQARQAYQSSGRYQLRIWRATLRQHILVACGCKMPLASGQHLGYVDLRGRVKKGAKWVSAYAGAPSKTPRNTLSADRQWTFKNWKQELGRMK